MEIRHLHSFKAEITLLQDRVWRHPAWILEDMFPFELGRVWCILKFKKNNSFLSLRIQILFCVSIIARLNVYQHCQLFYISPIIKTLVLLSVFPFSSICQLFCHIFFTWLSVTSLLYIEPLNWIIGILIKNSPALLLNIMSQKLKNANIKDYRWN